MNKLTNELGFKPYHKLIRMHNKNLPKFIDHTGMSLSREMQTGDAIVIEHTFDHLKNK